jgi:hypothetical protein
VAPHMDWSLQAHYSIIVMPLTFIHLQCSTRVCCGAWTPKVGAAKRNSVHRACRSLVSCVSCVPWNEILAHLFMQRARFRA